MYDQLIELMSQPKNRTAARTVCTLLRNAYGEKACWVEDCFTAVAEHIDNKATLRPPKINYQGAFNILTDLQNHHPQTLAMLQACVVICAKAAQEPI